MAPNTSLLSRAQQSVTSKHPELVQDFLDNGPGGSFFHQQVEFPFEPMET